MSSIHYRFRSSSEYETITFDGPSISVTELREAIMESNHMAKSPSHTLEITNAQSKQVYHSDSFMVPKNSSVVVKRVPIQRPEAVTAATSGLSKEEEELTEIAFAKLTQTPDLANTEAPEDEKIKAMIKQSTDVFNPSQYLNVRRAPPHYQCYRCNGKGHYLKDCPTQGDSRYNNSQYQRVPSGIPRAYFLLKLKQEEQLLSKLRAMQPENSRFSPVVGSDVVDQTKIPSELQCPMCKKLFTDVVVTPCCGFSYCDGCIRNWLVEHDLTCVCKEMTSPDNLIANKSLRISVSNFRNQKKSEMKSVPPSPGSASPPQSVTCAPLVTTNATNVQPAIESSIIQVKPPDVHSDSSQSSLPNGLITTDSGQDSDSLVDNSLKKVVLESRDTSNSPLNVTNGNSQPPTSQQIVVPTTDADVVNALSVSQASMIRGSIASQVVPHPFSGPAMYSNVQSSMRPGLILPQQQPHIVPHQAVITPSHPLGISIPPGATIVKRLVPVPVGPRLGPNQIRLAQAQAQAQAQVHMMASGGLNPHMVEPIRARGELIKTNEKHRGNEAASPMPLTEDEFYLWQQQFKKRTTTTSRRRHRSSSLDESRDRDRRDGSRERGGRDGSRERERRDGSRERERRDGSREKERFRSLSGSRSRSRSRSPQGDRKRQLRKEGDPTFSPTRSKKKYDSADDSSQERKRKEVKMKRKHRETSQGSGGNSDSSKARHRAEKKGKTRELPEHIKREIDEFEFDNELEFDEELRNLRKTKQKRKLDDEHISSPEGSLSPSKSVELKRSDSKDDIEIIHSPGLGKEDGVPTPVTEKSVDNKTQTLENAGNVKALEHESKICNDEKSSNDGKLNSSSELTSPVVGENTVKPADGTDGKPKKKTKIIKKMVVRRVKVTRKKPKTTVTTPTGSLPASTPETPTAGTPTEIPKSEEAGSSKMLETPKTIETSVPKEAVATSETESVDPNSIEIPKTVIDPEEAESLVTDSGENDLSKSEKDAGVLDLHSTSTSDNSLVFDSSVIISDQPLPENSCWVTGGKPKSSHHSKTNEIHKSVSPKPPKTLDLEGIVGSQDRDSKTEKKKSRRDAEKVAEKSEGTKPAKGGSENGDTVAKVPKAAADVARIKSAVSKDKLLAIKQMHANKTKLTSEVRAKKEAEKQALIEKSKKNASERAKADGKEGSTAADDEERKRRREKYMLLKKHRAKERALAERRKAKKMESEGDTVIKAKLKARGDTDHSDGIIGDDRKSDQGNYKPADAKLKSISEITKKRLKQSDGCEPKKNEIEDEASDVLKSKVTSIKTVIAAAEKRRVIKTSVSEERELTAAVFPEDLHVRRVIKVGDNRKKSLVSKVEKLAATTDKSITLRGEHEKRRHRDDEREREHDDAMDRDRYERRVRLREEENLRREVKDKIRLREMEKEMQEMEEQKVKSLEKEKLEGLERERVAIKEKEKLERKLKRERQLREDMLREKEQKDENEKKKDEGNKRRHDKRKVTIDKNSDSANSDDQKSNKHTKKEKAKPGYIIQIIDSDKSDSKSDSTDVDAREKKRKKKNKKRKEKKKRKKKSEDNKVEERGDSEDSSDEDTDDKKKKKRKKEETGGSSEEEEEDSKKKKRKKHKKKHKKHRRVKKTKKKSKKKKLRKERESDSETEDNQGQPSGEESGEESGTESTKDDKSSSSDGESGASSSSDKKKDSNVISKTDSSADVAHVCTVQGRVNAKENMVESRPKDKSISPLSKNDNLTKDAPDRLTSHRDVGSKEKTASPKCERQSRESSETQRNERERDSISQSKKESKFNREPQSKYKSSTSRVDIQGLDRSAESIPEADVKEKLTVKERHSKRDSRSKSDVARPDRDTKKTEDRRSDRRKDLPTERLPLKDSKEERLPTPSPSHTKRNDTMTDDLELDYNDEDLGDLEDDVLYGDLDFADDEQTNPGASAENKRIKKKSDDFEDGEILDEDLFAASLKESKTSKTFKFDGSMDTETEERGKQKGDLSNVNIKSSDIEAAIENAVDDAINKHLDKDGSMSPPVKIKRTKSSDTTVTPKRVLRKR